MAAIGDLVELDEKRQAQVMWGCLYKSPDFVSAWATSEHGRAGDRFLVIGRRASQWDKRTLTGSNKRHMLQVVRLSDNVMFWVEPKYVRVIQKADS